MRSLSSRVKCGKPALPGTGATDVVDAARGREPDELAPVLEAFLDARLPRRLVGDEPLAVRRVVDGRVERRLTREAFRGGVRRGRRDAVDVAALVRPREVGE